MIFSETMLMFMNYIVSIQVSCKLFQYNISKNFGNGGNSDIFIIALTCIVVTNLTHRMWFNSSSLKKLSFLGILKPYSQGRIGLAPHRPYGRLYLYVVKHI